MTGKWLLAGGSAIFLSVGAAALVYWRNTQPAPATTGPTIIKSATPDPPTPAPTFFGDEVSLTGLIQAQKTVAVAAPIDGTIQEVMADAGSQIFQGQVIARIRNGRLDTTLESATAEVEKLKTRIANLEGSILAARLESSRAQVDALRAKSELDRTEKAYNRQVLLYKEGATPRLTFEKSEKDYKQAQTESDSLAALAKAAADRIDSQNLELDNAKKLLDQKSQELDTARGDVSSGEVQSPADGIVLTRKGQPGEQVTKAVADFFTIAVNLAVLQVVVEADASVKPRLKEGQQAVVRVAEFNEDLKGIVREIKGATITVEFANHTPEIKPGLTARVKIKLGKVP